MQHRNIADEVALPARGENLLPAFPRFKDFGFAAQNNGEPEIALPCLEDKLSALQCAPLPQRFQQRQLAIVEFRMGDALGIAIKLLVLFFVSHEIDCTGKSRSSGTGIAQLTRTSERRSITTAIEDRKTISRDCETFCARMEADV